VTLYLFAIFTLFDHEEPWFEGVVLVAVAA
jgi:hypothetical protein